MQDLSRLVAVCADHTNVQELLSQVEAGKNRLHIQGSKGSFSSILAMLCAQKSDKPVWIILNDKEEAAYFLNDLQNLSSEKRIAFFPDSYRRGFASDDTDNANVMMRAEVLGKISAGELDIVVSYSKALSEKVITRSALQKRTLTIHEGEKLDMDFVMDVLIEYDFERDDFVYEPGFFAMRGGLIDVFSYSEEYPVRVEFRGDTVQSIRAFDPETQLSVKTLQKVQIVPNIEDKKSNEQRLSLPQYTGENSIFIIFDIPVAQLSLDDAYTKAERYLAERAAPVHKPDTHALYMSGKEFVSDLSKQRVIEFSVKPYFTDSITHSFKMEVQPLIQKNFDLLLETIISYSNKQFINIILSDDPKQLDRIDAIFEELIPKKVGSSGFEKFYQRMDKGLSEGFVWEDGSLAVWCDHKIFDRYKRFKLKGQFSKDQAITLKELGTLSPGDFVTHIDHGIGRFAGLEKFEVNGKIQESVKLIYKDNDVLYVSIHSLHRIARYTGKEGTHPTAHKLGSGKWEATKAKTKKRIKEVAFDLIKLYAKRKSEPGFAYSKDGYMQNELEASFIYEDTPDQHKSTEDVKRDMERTWPMDRLVCGDVGFGKTEVAIRAAFKAACDGKQVAVLVPTTILAYQHFKTFSNRLKDFPVTIEYINRFRSSKQVSDILHRLSEGKIDILIGTHRVVGKDVKFKDLGLLIVDEEQKFGVSVKDKLKTLRANVDSLTLTATPIPRTLQFSLIGARDLSIIRTPPPNRYPVSTEWVTFNEEVIRDAIHYELQRNGQVYFVHNRINDIQDIAGMIQRLVPDSTIRIAHGQMPGDQLEEVMLGFIEGEFDILIATSIVESGLDVPNANTMIVNQAQNFGLSDLHQLRGRVGRSNKKAFCYLITPPELALTDEGRKRMRAITEFSELGSGFQIAMRDLDIRGAGELLGAEQSGFISDIGYETYQRILNEAVQELKETEFKELYKEELENPNREWVMDCTIETDLQILIPESYVDQTEERLALYKELDSLNSEEELDTYKSMLEDRFGDIPEETYGLMEAVRVRKLARKLGVERLTFKRNVLNLYFTTNPSYFQSDVFGRVLAYLQTTMQGEMKQNKDRLNIVFREINTLDDVKHLLMQLHGEKVENG